MRLMGPMYARLAADRNTPATKCMSPSRLTPSRDNYSATPNKEKYQINCVNFVITMTGNVCTLPNVYKPGSKRSEMQVFTLMALIAI